MKVKVLTDIFNLSSDGADVIIAPCDTPTVYYKRELTGETSNLKKLAKLTENKNFALISPFDTDNYGIVKRSAGVFSDGKLVGISDMTTAFEDSPYMPSASSSLYHLKCGKIGVAVSDDLYSYELFRSFTVCGANLCVVLKNDKFKQTDEIVVRAYSYLLGIPIVYYSKNFRFNSNCKGEIVDKSNSDSVFETLTAVEYHIKFSRTRFSR